MKGLVTALALFTFPLSFLHKYISAKVTKEEVDLVTQLSH